MQILTVFVLALFSVCNLITGEPPAVCKKCIQSNTCNPPDCFCCREDLKLPRLNRISEIPQIVFFTFDDAVTDQVAGFYYQLFDPSRKNPNGCPISMTLFISHDNTKYRLVSDFHKRGMEIASHSVTHSTMNGSNFFEEAKGQKENLAKLANIPVNEITGWRSPFLKPTGDLQPDALKKLGYDYDATLTFSKRSFREKPPGPFTLDFGFPYECQVKPCPKHKHPGFWEVPVVSLMDYMQKYDCVYVDGCMNAPPNEEAAYKFLWENFQTYYTQTRMPFGINMHSSWFFYPDRLKAMDRFIKKLVSLNDVYIISANRMLEWLKNPTPLQDARSFAPWACDGREKKFKSGPKLAKTNLPPPPMSWVPRRLGINARRMFENNSPSSSSTNRQTPTMDSMRSASPGQNALNVKPTVLFRPTDNRDPRVPNTQFETQQQRLRNNLLQRQSDRWPPRVTNVDNSADMNSFGNRMSSASRRDQSSRRNMLEQHEQLIRQQKRLEEARVQQEERLRKEREQEQMRRQKELLERQQALLADQQQNELLRQQRRLQQQQLQQQQVQRLRQQQQSQRQQQQQQQSQRQQQQQHSQRQQHKPEAKQSQPSQPLLKVQFINEQNNRSPQNLRTRHRDLMEKQQQSMLQQERKNQQLQRQRLQEDLPATIDSKQPQVDIKAHHRDLLVLQQSLQDKQTKGSIKPDDPQSQRQANIRESDSSVRPENMVKQKTVVWQPTSGSERKPNKTQSSPRSSSRNEFLQETVKLWPQSNVFGTRAPVESSNRADDPTLSRFNERQSSSKRNNNDLLRRIEEPALTGNVAPVTPATNSNARVPFRYTDSPRHLWYTDFTARFGPMNNGPRFSRGGSNRRPGFRSAPSSPRSQPRQRQIIPRLRPDSVTLTSGRRGNGNRPSRQPSQGTSDRQQRQRNNGGQRRNNAQAVSFRERIVTDNQRPRIPFSGGVLHPSVSQQIAWNSFIRNMLGQH